MTGSTIALVLTASLSASVLTAAAIKVMERSDTELSEAENLPRPTTRQPVEPSELKDLLTQLDSMADSLDGASAERSQLASSLREMNQRVNAMNEQLAALETPDQLGLSPESSPHSAEELASFQSEGSRATDDRGQSDHLIAAGVDQSVAQDIEARQNRYQLARLDLIDQAEREGWRDSDEFGERLEALSEEQVDLRSELGDETFDRFLYEQGRSNRVGIESVIGGSAAFQAGIRAGDMIVSYADGRVFRLPELQEATRSGQRGEYVQVTLFRDGELIAVDVPRGPLGVTLRRMRREPS